MNKIRLTVSAICLVVGLTAIESSAFIGVNDLNGVLVNWNFTVPLNPFLPDIAGGDGPEVLGGPDGFVGVADLNYVLTFWNQVPPPVGEVTTTVPEPGTLLILTIGSMSLMRRTHRRGSSA